mgnify:CR=1 FL=1
MGNNMRLGKGLEALLGNVAASAPAEQDESKESVRILSINQIDPNPYQPRQEFDDAEMQDLADSIAVHGVIQPILVTSHGQGRYTLVYHCSRRTPLACCAPGGSDGDPCIDQGYLGHTGHGDCSH